MLLIIHWAVVDLFYSKYSINLIRFIIASNTSMYLKEGKFSKVSSSKVFYRN